MCNNHSFLMHSKSVQSSYAHEIFMILWGKTIYVDLDPQFYFAFTFTLISYKISLKQRQGYLV